MTPLSFLRGCIALARGDQARGNADPGRGSPGVRQKPLPTRPTSAERHANLGLVYAFMGRRDEAIREGRRAVELKPISKDATDGALMLCYLALIYARVGENDQAIPLIERS